MKQVSVVKIQPDPDGPLFSRVMTSEDFMNSQEFAHDHITRVVKRLLVAGAAASQVAGLAATLVDHLKISIAAGDVFDANGVAYELDNAFQVTLDAADAALPRIDRIFATLSIDAPADTEFRPHRRLRTQAEFEANLEPYPPVQYDVPGELQTIVTINVRKGTPNASPVAPALNAGEVPLWQVHVAATQTVLGGGDLTDERLTIKSLYAVVLELVTINATLAAAEMLAHKGQNNGYAPLDSSGKLPLNRLQYTPVNQAGDAMLGALSLPNFTNLVLNYSDGIHVWQIFCDYSAGPNAGPDGFCIARGGTHSAGGSAALAITTAGQVSIGGNLVVGGSISKGSGTFHIDHPTDPNNRDLIHGFIEAPRYELIYRGSVQLVNGAAVVDIDAASGMTAGTFAALTQRAQGEAWNESSDENNFDLVRLWKIEGSKAFIKSNDPNATFKVGWLVIAERNDLFIKTSEGTDSEGHLIVELDKPAGDASLLEPITEVVRAEAAAPSQTRDRVVDALIGTRGFPRHAQHTGQGAIPKRRVTTEIHDLEGTPYSHVE
jgi:hypothetical protein